MAVLGEWSGGATTLLPGTSWAAPNGLFPTQDRNDSSAYSFASSTSTLTLPSSGLADGYLVVGSFEFEDTSNGRHNPAARFIQSGGTGNFVSNASSGYNRDNSEDRAYVQCWAFIDSPSAAATIQFQWQRDADAPTGGTVRSSFKVVPLYYSNHGVYSSASTSKPGGATPNQVTGFSAISESDTAAIEIASNTVTVKGDNKRYLCLGGQFWDDASGNTRTQRWHGFRVDGTLDNSARAYTYMRNNANDICGELFTQLIETATTDRTVDQIVFRGEALGTFPETGADVDGSTTGTNPQHAMVILELNDSAEVFSGTSNTQSNLQTAGARVELNIAETVNFNDAASFTKADNNGFNVEQTCDVLFGANISGGYAATSTARYTGYAELTINGTGQSNNFAGDYGRGNQGTIDTWGWSANMLGFQAVTANEDIGVNAGKITGGEGGTVDALAGWQGFWGVNLDTLEDTGGGVSGTLSAQEAGGDTFAGSGDVPISGTVAALETGSDTLTGSGAIAIEGSLVAQEAGSDSFASSGGVEVQGALAAQDSGSDSFNASGAVTDPGIVGTLSAQETGSDSFTSAGEVAISGSFATQEAGTDGFSGSGAVLVDGALSAQELGTDTFSASGTLDNSVTGALAAQETGDDTFAASGAVAVAGDIAAVETGSDVFSASGTVDVPITGSLAAQEVGQGVFSATGTAAVQATMAAREADNDNFSADSRPNRAFGWSKPFVNHRRAKG